MLSDEHPRVIFLVDPYSCSVVVDEYTGVNFYYVHTECLYVLHMPMTEAFEVKHELNLLGMALSKLCKIHD